MSPYATGISNEDIFIETCLISSVLKAVFTSWSARRCTLSGRCFLVSENRAFVVEQVDYF